MKKISFIFLFFTLAFFTKAQNITMGNGTQIITCGTTYNFYDPGGSGANYADNLSNTLTLVPSVAGQCLQINFSSFTTESGFDPISFYDGNSTAAPLIGTYSGATLPPITTSTSGSITIKFVSDGSVNYAGWVATIQCVACPPPPPPSYVMSNAAVTLTCPNSYVFYDSGGSLANYSDNENFTKTFTAPAGQCIRFSFNTAFQLESCCDLLKIFDGPSGASPLIGSYTGVTAPGIITSSGGSITFSFTSDGSVNYAGWSATISCVPACAGMPSGGAGTVAGGGCLGPGLVALSSFGYSTGCGITYQWQTGPTAAGPWVNVAGATAPTMTVASSPNFYHLLATCGANTGTGTAIAATTGTSVSCSLSTYVASPTAYSFDVFAGTTCPSTDDVLYTSIAMTGFPFCFTGAQYWGGYIASNGAFVFDAVPCFPNIQSGIYAAPGIGTGWSITAAAPVNNTSIPRNAILGPWQDIDPGLGGVIRYGILGVAPNRRFVISFEGVPMFSCGVGAGAGNYFWGQIKLFETTNNIEIHVKQKQLCTTWNGGYAVMGLHSFDATTYIPPVNATAHNFPTQWTMTNTAYKFTSPCASSVCVVLPIHFKSFYGERIQTVNHLYWETSEEESIKTFIVERSSDAQNFVEIARVNPKNTPSKYQYDDISAMPGILNYYRITSVEKNGQRNTTTVYPLGSNDGEIMVSGIFPNPAKSDITISVDSKVITTVIVNIYDAFGKVVKSFSNDVSKGVSQLNLYIGDVTPGIYVVETTTPKKEVVSQQKFIKVN